MWVACQDVGKGLESDSLLIVVDKSGFCHQQGKYLPF